MRTMKKGRLVAFFDAVLAIIMTILVLNLQQPRDPTLAAFWDLRENFFAYALSFFWLGSLWSSMNRIWQNVQVINRKVVILSLILLFFCSFFPYGCSLASTYFYNRVAQAFYGVLVFAVTFTNYFLHTALEKLNGNCPVLMRIIDEYRRLIEFDTIIKVIALLLAIFWYPPCMMYGTFIALGYMKVGEYILSRNNLKRLQAQKAAAAFEGNLTEAKGDQKTDSSASVQKGAPQQSEDPDVPDEKPGDSSKKQNE